MMIDEMIFAPIIMKNVTCDKATQRTKFESARIGLRTSIYVIKELCCKVLRTEKSIFHSYNF